MNGEDFRNALEKASELCAQSVTRFLREFPRAPQIRTLELCIEIDRVSLDIPEQHIKEMMEDHFSNDTLLTDGLEEIARKVRPEFPSLVRSLGVTIGSEVLTSGNQHSFVKADCLGFSINGMEAPAFPRSIDRLEGISGKFHRLDHTPVSWIVLETGSSGFNHNGLTLDAGTEEEAILLLAAIQYGPYGLDAILEGNSADISHWFDKVHLIRAPEQSAASLILERGTRISPDVENSGPA
jgi:hypothetical protein